MERMMISNKPANVESLKQLIRITRLSKFRTAAGLDPSIDAFNKELSEAAEHLDKALKILEDM
jgi:hypothetical protein